MLLSTYRLAQQAAPRCRMDVSGITMLQVVYQLDDSPWAVSKSEIQSVSRLQSLPYSSRLKNCELRTGVGIYTYLGGKSSIWEHYAPSARLGDAGGVLSSRCFGSGGWVPVPLRLQRVCEFIVLRFWQRRQPSSSYWWIIALFASVTAFTISS